MVGKGKGDEEMSNKELSNKELKELKELKTIGDEEMRR